MLSLSKYQRIKHLQLQGFTVEQAAKMQSVGLIEVEKIYNEDKVFKDEVTFKKKRYERKIRVQ
jgi:hypothetical protein